MVKKYLLSEGDVQLSEHFMLHEFQSHVNGNDRADDILLNPALVDALESIRASVPECQLIFISSGYRTPAASIAVGGYATDQHTKGNAADINCYDDNGNLISQKLVACVAQNLQLPGIGYGGSYCHVDVGDRYWHGDETNGNNNVSDYYSYFGINVAESEPEPAQSEAVAEESALETVAVMGGEDAQVYYITDCIEYLRRLPDPTGFATYVNALMSGSMSEEEVDAALLASDEYKKNFIYDTFQLLLHREPESEEVVNHYMGYERKRDIVRDIYCSEEYMNMH